MDYNKIALEPFLEQVEHYSKKSIELIKLKFIDKFSNLLSKLFSKIIIITVFFFFGINLTLAIALWLGELLGKIYFGFLAVSIFYAIVGLILWAIYPNIKLRINNWIIIKLLN